MARDRSGGISELSKAGKHRLDDARALLQAFRRRGAAYLAGYAVECQLKTKLMRMYDCLTLSELEAELRRRGLVDENATVFTHQLELLLRWTGALGRLRQSSEHWAVFNIVNRWVPAWRYSADLSSQEFAEDSLAAVQTLSLWIENNV